MKQVSCKINAKETGVAVNPQMIGLFFEDINYGADGGLYGELLENRSFDFFPTKLYPSISPLTAWYEIGRAMLSPETENPVNNVNPQYARINAVSGAGIANRAYEGIALVKGDAYDFSCYARGKYDGAIVVTLTSGGRTIASGSIAAISQEWARYALTLTANDTVQDAVLEITLEKAGTIDLDWCSLFPQKTFQNRKNGLRADMAQALKDMKPGFLRFPGGCIVEGNGLDNRYRWKDTIGPLEERPINFSRWQNAYVGADQIAPHYFQSYGLGFYEYFLLCEDLGCAPLPVLNCGMGCQYQCDETVPLDQLDEYIQDALDLIEFANGDTSTTWGAKRAALGHPEPFGLVYLGIGNEQWEQGYFERYECFQRVIAARYPDIKLVTSSGPYAAGKEFDAAWQWLSDKDRTFAYCVDEHYYVSPEWLFENTKRYDTYNRKLPKVFAGEYACHMPGAQPRANNLLAALAEAAMMTGFERNADVVHLASYAPLFARENYTQWTPDLIFVDNHRVLLTPSYYVQQMFAQNVPTYTVPFEMTEDNDLYVTCGVDSAAGELILKVVNRGVEAAELTLDAPYHGSATVLSGEALDAVNTFDAPGAVVPRTTEVDGAVLTLAPQSFSVYRLAL